MPAGVVGRRTLGELLRVAAALAVAFVVTVNCQHSYPLGRDVIRRCGDAAALAVLAAAVRPIRRALAEDAGEGA